MNEIARIHPSANAVSPRMSVVSPRDDMNGAEALLRTLVASGVNVCFANPGTSEMHFISALDRVPGMRAVLGLFEGVVTGAADGYARMAERPAATLLHLGPGLANGLANLHNARKAEVPMVNIIGDHATIHQRFDAPLTSDVAAFARTVSHWQVSSRGPKTVAADAARAVQAARLGARPDRQPDPAGGCGLAAGRTSRSTAAGQPACTGVRSRHRPVGGSPALGRTGCVAVARRSPARTRPQSGGPDCGGDRRAPHLRYLRAKDRTRSRPRRGRAPALPPRAGDSISARDPDL